jgi:citrate synthase
LPLKSGYPIADLQAALVELVPTAGLRPLLDIDGAQARQDLALASGLLIEWVAELACDDATDVGGREADENMTLAEHFVFRWTGRRDPQKSKAIDTYWCTAAEHGMNASTFTARVVASTGADIGACFSAALGALSGPLHGTAPGRVISMLDEVEGEEDLEKWVKSLLDRGQRMMGFGHRVYRAEDPRATALRQAAREIGARRYELAIELEKVAVEELASRHPGRPLLANVEFWAAVMLDHVGLPPALFTPLFACARSAGWSAHILEQKALAKLVRPSARYVGPPPRPWGALAAV